VTVVGPPGIGKTRLCLEYLHAHAVGNQAADVSWHCFCDLGDVKDERELASAVARQVGFAPPRAKPRLDPNTALLRALSGRGSGLSLRPEIFDLKKTALSSPRRLLSSPFTRPSFPLPRAKVGGPRSLHTGIAGPSRSTFVVNAK
jgi:hypothetical protein